MLVHLGTWQFKQKRRQGPTETRRFISLSRSRLLLLVSLSPFLLVSLVYPPDSAKNLPGISIGGKVLFSTDPASSGRPSGRTRISSPPWDWPLIPAPIRRTTRFPEPVLR